jgi:hypothetical protein
VRRPLRAAAFSPDGRWLVVTIEGDEKGPRLWDLSDGDPKRHERRLSVNDPRAPTVTAVAFDSLGRWLVTGGQDGTTRSHRLDGGRARAGAAAEGREAAAQVRHQGDLLKIVVSADRRAVVSVGREGTARLWRLERRELVPQAALAGSEPGDPIVDAAFSADGRRLLTVTVNGNARRWVVRQEDLLREARLIVGPPREDRWEAGAVIGARSIR